MPDLPCSLPPAGPFLSYGTMILPEPLTSTPSLLVSNTLSFSFFLLLKCLLVIVSGTGTPRIVDVLAAADTIFTYSLYLSYSIFLIPFSSFLPSSPPHPFSAEGRAPSVLNGGLSNEWIIAAGVFTLIVGAFLEFKSFEMVSGERFKLGLVI
jgi:hypothetical protein